MIKKTERQKKVGGVVIMHDNHNNYGTSLQGFATVKVIQELGYKLRIIRYKNKRSFKEILKTGPLMLISGVHHEIMQRLFKKINIKFRKEYSKNLTIRTKAVNQFKAKYFEPISDFYEGFKNLQIGSKNYDIIFVGSDQVWGTLSLYSRFYNLLFVDDNIPKFSYASSFGVSNIFKWQLKGTKYFLDRLKAIGVREIRGKEIVDTLSENKAKVVADPTILIDKKKWEEYISESKFDIKEPYIFCYILGKRKLVREEIVQLKKKTGLKILYFRHTDEYISQDKRFGDIAPYDVSPLDFAKLLKNAEYICTDSLHGTIFSVIFHKLFITFYRSNINSSNSKHSRIESLLKMLNLEDRLHRNNIYKQISQSIDYKTVDEKLYDFRNSSLNFLKSCLNNNFQSF